MTVFDLVAWMEEIAAIWALPKMRTPNTRSTALCFLRNFRYETNPSPQTSLCLRFVEILSKHPAFFLLPLAQDVHAAADYFELACGHPVPELLVGNKRSGLCGALFEMWLTMSPAMGATGVLRVLHG